MKPFSYVSVALPLLLPVAAFAVGTWGGAEPPSGDDLYTNAPWWMIPVGFVIIFAQIYMFGRWPIQMAGLVAAFLAGATADKWFGATAGWIVAVVVFVLFYRWLKPAEPSPPQTTPQKNTPVSKSPSPQEQANSRDNAKGTDHRVSSNNPSVQQPNPRTKEVERLAELRYRMDLEMKQNGGMDSRKGKATNFPAKKT